METWILILSSISLACIIMVMYFHSHITSRQTALNEELLKELKLLDKEIKHLQDSLATEVANSIAFENEITRVSAGIAEAADWAHNVDVFIDIVCESNKRVKEKFNNRVASEKGVSSELGVSESNDKSIGQEQETKA